MSFPSIGEHGEEYYNRKRRAMIELYCFVQISGHQAKILAAFINKHNKKVAISVLLLHFGLCCQPCNGIFL